MTTLETLLRGLLIATPLLWGFSSDSDAVEYRFKITGTVNAVEATVNPAADYFGPPPEVSPAFAARFAIGHPVVTEFTYADGVMDIMPSTTIGTYPLSSVPGGWVGVDGEQYLLGAGSISASLGETDQYLFHAFNSQEISNPVAASGIMLNIAFSGGSLLNSDALVPPPHAWDSAFGDLLFDAGLFWQRIRFSVDQVEVTAVPEPSTLAVAITMFLAGCCCRRRGC